MDYEWETIQRPGFFGKRRDLINGGFDLDYGPGNWRIAWQIGDRVGGFAEAVMLYEDSYFEFLSARPELTSYLTSDASDVYDDSLTNIASGIDYARQESIRTHLQDIAIRRSLVRLGMAFRGLKPVQIRHQWGEAPIHPLGYLLSPSTVPFHRRDLLVEPLLEGWWSEVGGVRSVEGFYQSNKLLQRLMVK